MAKSVTVRNVDYKISDAMSRITVKITFKGLTTMKIRSNIAMWFFKIGGFIMPCKVDIEKD